MIALAAAVLALASPVVDRTLDCDVGIQGGIRVVGLHAIGASAGKDNASVELRTNLRPAWRLASIGEGSVELSPSCRSSTAQVPLTSRTLAGGATGPFGDSWDCWTRPRVLIRVRATFGSPVALRRGSPYGFPLLFARGRVKEASLAMRTPGGKPLVFGTVAETGRARVFMSSSSCFPD